MNFRTLDHKLRLVGFASGGATSVKYLFNNQESNNYEVAGVVFSKKTASGITWFNDKKVPIIVHDVNDFYKAKGLDSIKDKSVRGAYEYALLPALEKLKPDLLCLSGYMLLLTQLHNIFPTINVHPADLAITENGKRKYIGDNAVYDAVLAGEREVRSTIHLVTNDCDGGPIIVRSKPVIVPDFNKDEIKSVCKNLQDLMKQECDNPAYLWAVNAVANNDLKLKNNCVYYKSKALPNSGFVLNK